MKRSVLCGAVAFVLLSCGSGGGGGADKKSDASQQQQPQKGTEAQDVVTIDGPAQQRANIRVARIEPRSVPESFSASGQIVMDEERTSHIGTYTDGRITELKANVGDFVKRGQVLARMHSHDVHETRAAYETALEDVRRQQSAVAYAEQMRERMIRLYELKSASRQEVDKAETDLRSAQTDLANAKIAVQKEVAHLTDILHLPPSALQNINETTEQVPVIAPTSGIVVNRMITLGSVVEPGQEVYTVTDLGIVWMMAAIYEPEISKVHVGEKASVSTPAFPGEAFPGEVTRLGTELDPKTRTLPVRIAVPNTSHKLRPEMFATAQVMQGRSHQAIFVPEVAVQDLNGGSIVFVRTQPNKFQMRPVEIAHRLNGEAEIASGLKLGDDVVEQGSFVVKSQMLKSQIGE